MNFIPKGNLTVKTDTTPTHTKLKFDTTQSHSSDYLVNSETKVSSCANFSEGSKYDVFSIFLQKLGAGELLNRTHEELVLV